MHVIRGDIGSRLQDEHGSVIVFVAGTLMVLVLIAVFVVDVGNWFVHRRHLQTQADAAALAAANSLGYPCDWTAAIAEGQLYGDDLNPQVGGANRGAITLLFNSPIFASGVPPAVDDTQTGSACDTGVVDVKATEARLPLFFVNAVPGLSDVTINAHARAKVFPLKAMSGMLPLAVEDSNPKFAFARFTLADGSPVPSCPDDCLVWLEKGDPRPGMTAWVSPASLAVPTMASLSLQVGLVYSKTRRSDCSAFPAVQCNDRVGYVRIWDTAAALRNVRIVPGTCAPDGYFATASCGLGLEAELNLGDARPLSGTGITTKVWATIAGNHTNYDLLPGSPGPGTVTWSRPGGIPLTAAPAASPITVHWEWTRTEGDGCTKAKPCTVSGSQLAQRAYLADDSVPLELVQIGDPMQFSAVNSLEAGGSHQVLVTVGVHNSLTAAASAGDTTVMLRTASGSSSNSQALDCDANKLNFSDEIRDGCTTPYQLNETAVCPNGDSPASCILTQPGDFLGQLRTGLNERFGCPVNNWGDVPPGDLTTADKRLVPLLIVPPATFSDAGAHLVPVLQFAFFYVTGWDGGAGCPENQPYPGTGAPHGDVWGHFVKYTGSVPNAEPGEGTCDLQSGDPGACVVALTR